MGPKVQSQQERDCFALSILRWKTKVTPSSSFLCPNYAQTHYTCFQCEEEKKKHIKVKRNKTTCQITDKLYEDFSKGRKITGRVKECTCSAWNMEKAKAQETF